MDSKWGGKTETINMKLNVEQVHNFSNHNICVSAKPEAHTSSDLIHYYPTLSQYFFPAKFYSLVFDNFFSLFSLFIIHGFNCFKVDVNEVRSNF